MSFSFTQKEERRERAAESFDCFKKFLGKRIKFCAHNKVHKFKWSQLLKALREHLERKREQKNWIDNDFVRFYLRIV